jgi:hypothetical protein
LVISDLTPASGLAACAAMSAPVPTPPVAMTAAASAPNARPVKEDVDGVSTSCLSRRHSPSYDASTPPRPVASALTFLTFLTFLTPFALTVRHRAWDGAHLAASDATPACAATVAAMVR